MAHHNLHGHWVRDHYLQAIKNYDINKLVCEAGSRHILTDAERNELRRQRSSSSRRESFVTLMIRHGVRGRDFILDFSRRAHEQTQRQFELVYEAMLPKPNATNAASPNRYVGSIKPREGLSQSSQDSSSNSDSTSPMECDPEQMHLKKDGGYFSIASSCDSQRKPSYTSIDYTEKPFKSFQDVHRCNSRKEQSQQLMINLSSPSQSSQGTLMPGTVGSVNNSYFFNILQVDSGSDKHGANMTEYPGIVSTSRLPACDDLSSSCNGSIQQWENSPRNRFLDEHHCKIIGLLDVTSLQPHLWEKRLLTPTERDVLDSKCATPHEQARYLLKILPRKGERGFQQFLECLKDEKDHMGHAELVKWLDLYSQTPIEV